MTSSAGPAEAGSLPLHVIHCPPDDLFCMGDAYREGEVVRASMPLDDRSEGADGRTALGYLGVLVDNVLGYASMITTPGRWSVTTQMTLDAFPALQGARDEVQALGQVIEANGFNGFASGRVHSADGALVATCTQHLRFLAGLPDLESTGTESPTAEQLRRMRPDSLLCGDAQDSGASVRFRVGPELRNPLGNLHGGVSLYACDLAVARALRLAGAPFAITSLQVSFLRPVAVGTWIDFRPTVVHQGRTLAVIDVVGIIAGRGPAVIARANAQPVTA